MLEANALKPTGKLAQDSEAWMAALQRRAVSKVSQSEKETLARVKRTWEELYKFVHYNELSFEDLGIVALEKFLFEGSAQARVLAAVKWMENNLHLKWPIQDIIQPSKAGSRKYTSQATCAEPAMVAKLEEAIVT